MEDSEEILLHSLSSSGVPIPDGVSTVRDLTPTSLFSVCSHALRRIDCSRYASSFPASLPEDSMPDRIKICSDLATAFNDLGFKPELSFHKFLYPSKDDLYKLVRFLVGKASESSGSVPAALGNENKIMCAAKELGDEDNLDRKTAECNSVLPDESRVGDNDLSLNRCNLSDPSFQGVESSRQRAVRYQDGFQNNELLEKTVAAKFSELQNLDEQGLLKVAAEMVFGGEHPVEYYIEQLNDQVEAKRLKLKEMESEWDAMEKPLPEQKINLEESLSQLNPDLSRKLAQTKEMELETEVIAEIKRREEELSKLSSDLEKQPKQAPRRSYIERIKEITKNSRKQDNDIQKILKDTRELQLESNTIQERLNRTYAVVNETVFREAKKDPVARQAYRLLTDIHESFEQIAEKILAADRSRRDAADYETKLATISSRSFSIDKLQADLDAIRKENNLLEQRLHNL